MRGAGLTIRVGLPGLRPVGLRLAFVLCPRGVHGLVEKRQSHIRLF